MLLKKSIFLKQVQQEDFHHCMSKAINDSNIKGTIHTIDIISGENKIYWNCIDDHDGPKTRIEFRQLEK